MPKLGSAAIALALLVIPSTTLTFGVAAATPGFDGSAPYAVTTGGTEPYGLAVGEGGTDLFVTHLKSPNIQVIDTVTADVVRTIDVGSGGSGIAVAPDGAVWVTQNATATISRIADPLGSSPTVTPYTLPTGSKPSGIALSPDGTKVYVVEEGAKQVQELKATDGTIIATTPAGAFTNVPSGIAVTPDGDVWVGGDSLTAFDPTLATQRSLTRLQPDGFAGTPLLSPDGHTLYVGRESSIQAIDADTHALAGTMSTTVDAGIAGCTGCTALGEQITHLAVTPDGRSLYATNYNYPWRTRIDIAPALAATDSAFHLVPGPTAQGADTTDTGTWQYANEMAVVGDALWTASDGSNYDGTTVQRDPIAPDAALGTTAARVGDTVTITGSALADATVSLDGIPIALDHDDFSSIAFTMPAYADAHAVVVTLSTPSTGTTPVDVGSLDYTLRTFTSQAPAIRGVSGGKAHVGAALTADPGTWPAGTTVHYQWYRSDGWAAIPGATGRTYTPTVSDYTGKHRIAVAVSATKPGYQASSSAKSSAYAVAAGTLGKSTPTISGKAAIGKLLKANHRTWTAGTAFRYQWFAAGRQIPHATKASYKIAKKYAGKKITVAVTGSKKGYATAKVVSKPTAKVGRH